MSVGLIESLGVARAPQVSNILCDHISESLRPETAAAARSDLELGRLRIGVGPFSTSLRVNHNQRSTEEWNLTVLISDIISESLNHYSPEVSEVKYFRELLDHSRFDTQFFNSDS